MGSRRITASSAPALTVFWRPRPNNTQRRLILFSRLRRMPRWICRSRRRFPRYIPSWPSTVVLSLKELICNDSLPQTTLCAAGIRALSRIHAVLSLLNRSAATCGDHSQNQRTDLGSIYQRRNIAQGHGLVSHQFWSVVCCWRSELVFWSDRGLGARALFFPR